MPAVLGQGQQVGDGLGVAGASGGDPERGKGEELGERGVAPVVVAWVEDLDKLVITDDEHELGWGREEGPGCLGLLEVEATIA